MKFNFFRKKSNVECTKCGKRFKSEIELTDHNRTAHGTRKLRPAVNLGIPQSQF